MKVAPIRIGILRMRSGGNQTFLLKTRDLPGGIYQVSLLDKTGNMLCERFTFVQPNKLNSIQLNGIKDIYRPFEPIRCEIQVTDQKGNPLQGSLSISVRDAIRSDYAEYDNNIFTDMLLTSGFKRDILINRGIILQILHFANCKNLMFCSWFTVGVNMTYHNLFPVKMKS